MTGVIEKALEEAGVTLPKPAAAIANYVPFVIDGSRLYISGQLPLGPQGVEFRGKIGGSISVEDGATAARLCALNILAQARLALGNLDRIEQLVKLTGFVNCTPDFTGHPVVINGASDFMVQILGDRGKHARSAVGCVGLPLDASVEIEAIFRVAV